MNVYELKRTLQRRNYVLAIRAAQYGINVAPEVAMELEDLQRALPLLQRVIDNHKAGAQIAPEQVTVDEGRLKRALTSGTLSIVVYTFDYDEEM